VRVVGEADRGSGAFTLDDAIPDADALVTSAQGVVLAILTADCVPIVLHDPVAGVLACVHAGWRGTAARAAAAAVAAMQALGSRPADVTAGLGPAMARTAVTSGRPGRRAVGPAAPEQARAQAGLLVASGSVTETGEQPRRPKPAVRAGLRAAAPSSLVVETTPAPRSGAGRRDGSKALALWSVPSPDRGIPAGRAGLTDRRKVSVGSAAQLPGGRTRRGAGTRPPAAAVQGRAVLSRAEVLVVMARRERADRSGHRAADRTGRRAADRAVAITTRRSERAPGETSRSQRPERTSSAGSRFPTP